MWVNLRVDEKVSENKQNRIRALTAYKHRCLIYRTRVPLSDQYIRSRVLVPGVDAVSEHDVIIEQVYILMSTWMNN